MLKKIIKIKKSIWVKKRLKKRMIKKFFHKNWFLKNKWQKKEMNKRYFLKLYEYNKKLIKSILRNGTNGEISKKREVNEKENSKHN